MRRRSARWVSCWFDHGTGTVRESHEQLAGRIYIHAVTQPGKFRRRCSRALISAGRDPRYR
jgi:hypothetical protein